MAFGPQAGLDLVDALTSVPALKGYHWLPSVRGDLLARLGRIEEARLEFERAAALTHSAPELTLLRERAAACVRASDGMCTDADEAVDAGRFRRMSAASPLACEHFSAVVQGGEVGRAPAGDPAFPIRD